MSSVSGIWRSTSFDIRVRKGKEEDLLEVSLLWRTNSTDGVLTVCFQHAAMDLAIYHEVGRTDF